MSENTDFDSLFADEPARSPDERRSPAGSSERPPWKVLLVGDGTDMRDSLSLAMRKMDVERRPLELFEAHSAAEARSWLFAHPDVALVVLDVERETELAGLELIQHIRNELANRRVQILIFTSQAGYAPQRQVIIDHQIDGYRMKSEMTQDKIFVSVFGALRAFHAQLHVRRQREVLERMADELREREARMRAVIESAPDAIVLANAQGLVTGWNEGASKLFGCTDEEMLGRALARSTTGRRSRGEGKSALTNLDLDELPEMPGRTREVLGLRQDGQSVAVEIAVGTWDSVYGQNYSVIIRDISNRKRLEEEIRQLAFYDPLTQLPNRRLLLDRLAHTIAQCERSSCLGAVLVLDLDEFKTLNDTHGHDIGDLLLIEAGRRMKRCVRSIDTVGRLGGDEFLVVLGELSSNRQRAAVQALQVAEKIRAAVARPYALRPPQAKAAPVEFGCTATVGVALVDADSDWATLFEQADTAMYAAKAAGRNAVRLLDTTGRLSASGNGAKPIGSNGDGVKARAADGRR